MGVGHPSFVHLLVSARMGGAILWRPGSSGAWSWTAVIASEVPGYLPPRLHCSGGGNKLAQFQFVQSQVP